jgi:hypothetical protein
MADESQELQQEMARLRAQVQGLAEDVENAKTGLKAFGKATGEGALNVSKGLGSFALNVGKGDTSFKSLNSIVDITSNALGGMAKAIPFAGEAINAALKATAEASKFMLDQMDNTVKAFNELGKVGALTEAGMSGLQRQFIASGLSFQGFQKQVVENATALARFQGMTGDGAEAFSKIAGTLTRAGDDSLRRLGMSADQIGESVGAFVTRQTRLGLAQGKSNEELARGAKAYAVELDGLQKLTGLSREALQKQQDAALSEGRFRANIDELVAEGRIKEAEALMSLQSQMNAVGPQLGQGVRDLLSGAGTDAARALMASTGGAAQEILDRVKAGSLTSTQAALELQAASQRMGEVARTNAKYVGESNSAFLKYNEQSDLNTAKMVDGQLVRERQEKQMAKGTDNLTDQTVEAQRSMEGLARETAKLGFTFLPAASTAVKHFAKTMEQLVAYINEKVLGVTSSTTLDQQLQQQGARAGSTAAEMLGGAGPQSAAEEQALRANPAYQAERAGLGGGPPAVAPEDYVTFTSGTGDREHFGKLLPSVQAQFLEMAKAYNQMTGKKLQVNSAFRSPEEQAAVNPGTNPKAAPGMSLHNVGRALDIQSDQRADLDRMGLLSQYGFRPLAGDPPHVSAASGAILSGPMGGYSPNLTMHGTEAVVPLNQGSQQGVASMMDGSMMAAQLDKLDELVSIMKNQLSVSTKIMQYSS